MCASDGYPLNFNGREIVSKDSGNGAFGVISEIDPKEAAKPLLVQDVHAGKPVCDSLDRMSKDGLLRLMKKQSESFV